MTVSDVIAHLQTLDPALEVWVTWDESGEYWPASNPQGRVEWIVQETRRGKTRWESSFEDGKGKAVCVLLDSPFLPRPDNPTHPGADILPAPSGGGAYSGSGTTKSPERENR